MGNYPQNILIVYSTNPFFHIFTQQPFTSLVVPVGETYIFNLTNIKLSHWSV